MKHLVTGGSGFLGNLIACQLHERGEDVVVLDIWEDPDRPEGIEFIHCDIRDRDGVAKAMRGIDVVHHNVALVPLTKSGDKFWSVNVTGSEIAAEEAARANVKYFIHMSSSAIYGLPEQNPITADTPTNPIEIYGRGKLAGEQSVMRICEENDLPLIVIRPRTILGEGRLGIFQVLFEWISEDVNIYVIGDGNQKFQFVHAHDLMEAYMLIMDQGKEGQYNVGAAEFGTLREALGGLIEYAGSTSKIRSLPAGLAINTLRVLDWMNLSPLAPWHYLTYHKPFHFDMQPLLDLGWKPKYSNDDMFRESYDFFRANPEDKTAREDGSSIHRKPIKEKVLWLLKKIS